MNRNIVGAVVGVQPFGGHGLSGTGPKAGGAFYLQKLSQGGAWQAPTPDKAGVADESALPKLHALITQSGLDSAAQARLKAAIDTAQKTTLRHAVQTLNGPTGERNENRWHLPPHIALYGGDLESGLAALIPVAIAGWRSLKKPPTASSASATSPYPTTPAMYWRWHRCRWRSKPHSPPATARW